MSSAAVAAPTSKKGPLPLVLGVTGHRDLRPGDREALAGRVREVFEELQRRYPSTPLLLLSPLADGADRLVAEVALARGARLVVPLPMPQALYERDFDDPSRAQFRELLARAEHCFVLPLLGGYSEAQSSVTGRRGICSTPT